MTDPAPTAQVQNRFKVVLRPHRSLGPLGFLVLMGFIGTISFVAGIYFMLHGAWPVTGFFGLDALLVYGAFRLNYRAARLTETIEIADDELLILRVHPSGREERYAANPYWAQVHLAERPDGANRLLLRSHGKSLAVASFLNDDQRRDLAQTLSAALARARDRHRP